MFLHLIDKPNNLNKLNKLQELEVKGLRKKQGAKLEWELR